MSDDRRSQERRPPPTLLDELATGLAAAWGCPPGELEPALVFRWSDHPAVPGCPIGFAPGELMRWGPWLRRPHGDVLFAGVERSSWPNSMEGAVESGMAAGAGALRRLRGA